jgi:predicted nucleotide-binding protein
VKVFLSWSGQQSRDAAVLLRDFIPQVLQEVEPWLADGDLQSGQSIGHSINSAIETSDVAIACVTRANMSSTWMNYELGVAASSQKPILPVLVNLEPSELVAPLSSHLAIRLDRTGLRDLLLELNRAAEHPLYSQVLDDVFDINWPRLAPALTALLQADPTPTSAPDSATNDVFKGIESQFKAIRGLLENIDQRLPVIDNDAALRVAGPADGELGARPRIFVGSSAEGLAVAEAIQLGLDHVAEVVLWTQGSFAPGSTAIESLVELAPSFVYAVIVMTADDVLIKRGIEHKAPRDNLIFELGLFTGVTGRARTFLVSPRDEEIELPSDLQGVTKLDFQLQRSDNNIEAAVGTVCTRIKRVMGVA